MRRGQPRALRTAARSAEWVGRARTLTVPTGLIGLSADCLHRVVWTRPPYACQCQRPIGSRRRLACRAAQGWSRWYRDPTMYVEALDMDTRLLGQSATGGDLTEGGAPEVSSSGAISHDEACGLDMQPIAAGWLTKEASCDRLSQDEDEQ